MSNLVRVANSNRHLKASYKHPIIELLEQTWDILVAVLRTYVACEGASLCVCVCVWCVFASGRITRLRGVGRSPCPVFHTLPPSPPPTRAVVMTGPMFALCDGILKYAIRSTQAKFEPVVEEVVGKMLACFKVCAFPFGVCVCVCVCVCLVGKRWWGRDVV